MRTVEFQVPGLVDGTTPAPVLSFDPHSKLYKAPDPDGIVRFSTADMIALTGGNMGLVDPDFGMGGSCSDRFTQLLEVVTVGVGAVAGIQIVDAEGKVEQQEIVIGPEGSFYERDLVLVPKGSELRFFGYTATPAQPVVIRVSVVAFTSVGDYASLRQIACCSGGGVIPPGGDTGPTYIYRPGGVAGGNVYTDFTSLTAALALRAGPKWVEVDDIFVAIPTIPAGIWDVNQAIFQGLAGADQTLLRGLPGARIVNLHRIQGTLQLQNSDPAAATISLAGSEIFDVADGASLASIAGQPVIDVPGAGTAILRLSGSGLANLALGPAVGVSGGAGSGLLIQLWEGSTVDGDTVTSAVGSIVTAQMRSSAASFNRDQTPLLGELVFAYFVPDQQTPVNVGAGGTLPILGFASVTGNPVTLPPAIVSAGPIVVRNTLAVVLTITAGVGNTIDSGTSKTVPPGAVIVLKSDGISAWHTEQKSFFDFDAFGNAVPSVGSLTDVGSQSNRIRRVHGGLDVRVGSTPGPYYNPPTLTYNPDALGSIEAICVGYDLGGITEVYARPAMTWHSIKGRVANWDPAGSIARLNQYTIGFMRGSVYCYNSGTSRAEIEQGPGSHNSFMGGYVSSFSDNDAIMRHTNGGVVAFTWCRVYAYASGYGSPMVEVTGENAITFVNTGNEARVYSRHLAAFMQGLAYGVAPQYALMENVQGAACAFIQGRCQTTPGFDAKMRVEDDAGWATGRASGATIETRGGQASWARGFAQSGAVIYASGHGSIAWGWAPAGQTIGVAANNADQWGVGVNTLADSTRFGVGWRLKKTDGAPASPVDGDAWKAGADMLVSSGSASRNLSNVPTVLPLATLEARGTATNPAANVDDLAYDTTNKKWVRCESSVPASSVWVAVEGRDSILYKVVPAFNRLANTCVISDEPFVGNLVSNSEQAQGYTLITATGTSVASRIPTGDEARGVVRFTGTAAIFAGSGLRQLLDAIGPNGFGGGREIAWACRIKPSSAVPIVGDRDYAVFPGLANQVAGIAQPTDGPYWYFDKDTATWTLKAARDGNRSPQASALGWDTADYHWIGFLISADGTTLTGFVDSVAIAPIISGNVQPNDGVQSGFYADALGVSTQDLVVDIDHIVWGWTEIA